jgi:hypothetical protein
MSSESVWKRAMVRQLLREGSFARRIEDKYAVGSLDMLVVTPLYTIYTEAKLLNNIAALPASVAQRHQIELVNRVGNAFSRALVVGLRDGWMGFGLPGQRWDEHYTALWPTTIDNRLTDIFHVAVQTIWPNPRAYPPPG